MKDRRVEAFRTATLGLIASLDAVVRLSRWDSSVEQPPELLVLAKAKLEERRGIAEQLSSAGFSGSPADTKRVEAMRAAIKRLDAAYLTYRKDLESTPEGGDAAGVLEFELGETTTDLETASLH